MRGNLSVICFRLLTASEAEARVLGAWMAWLKPRPSRALAWQVCFGERKSRSLRYAVAVAPAWVGMTGHVVATFQLQL